jgi:hypothetical protein
LINSPKTEETEKSQKSLTIKKSPQNLKNVQKNIRENSNCEICWENLPKRGLADHSCDHKYCLNCLVGYIKHHLKTKNSLFIKCPKNNCAAHGRHSDIRDILLKGEYGSKGLSMFDKKLNQIGLVGRFAAKDQNCLKKFYKVKIYKVKNC